MGKTILSEKELLSKIDSFLNRKSLRYPELIFREKSTIN